MASYETLIAKTLFSKETHDKSLIEMSLLLSCWKNLPTTVKSHKDLQN